MYYAFKYIIAIYFVKINPNIGEIILDYVNINLTLLSIFYTVISNQ